MKKIQLLLLLPAIMAISCSKENNQAFPAQEEIRVENCQLNITLDNGVEGTKASAYTTVLPYEKKINSIELLIFNQNGTIEKYQRLTGTTCSVNVTQGVKYVYAFANCNGLSYITHTWELDDEYVYLSMCTQNGLPMHGNATVTCTANTSTPCSIELKRYAARVALTNVYLNLGTYVDEAAIESVFLTNVVSSIGMMPGGSIDDWCNIQGRNIDGDVISFWDGYDPDYMEQTSYYYDYWLDNDTDLIFEDDFNYPFIGYAFANSSTKTPNGYGSFNYSTGERTCLVVEAVINGELYYYPVVLDNGPLKENCAYTVSLTITGLGSKDPNVPIQKGTLSGTITVSNWETGSVYNKTI